MSRGFLEYRYYSPKYGMIMARISMTNDKGHEYFATIPVEGAQPFRQRRGAALDAIEEIIDLGLDPGEVMCR